MRKFIVWLQRVDPKLHQEINIHHVLNATDLDDAKAQLVIDGYSPSRYKFVGLYELVPNFTME